MIGREKLDENNVPTALEYRVAEHGLRNNKITKRLSKDVDSFTVGEGMVSIVISLVKTASARPLRTMLKEQVFCIA